MARTGIGGINSTRHGRTAGSIVTAASVAAFMHCCGGQAAAASGYFVHISDPHVTLVTQPQWQARLQHILDQSPRPDLVLCTGDLVEFGAGVSGALNYDLLLAPPITTEASNHYVGSGAGRIPIFFCPGNHDYRNISQSTVDLTNYKSKVHSDTYFHRIVGSYAIFSVNSGCDTTVTPTDLLPEGTGLFNSTAQPDVSRLTDDLDMLDGVVNGHDTSSYKKIVFMHHPHMYPAPGPICSLDGVFQEYNTQLIDTCEDFGVGWVLFGHLHPDESMVFDLGCDTWTTGETKCIVAVSARTSGYRRESLDGSGEDVIFEVFPTLPTVSTVSTWGVGVTMLLVLAVGSFVLLRRRYASA